MLMRLWREDEGVLTFEWIMLLTLLVIGVIGGVAGIRDAINQQCQNVVGAMVSLDQSYNVQPPLVVGVFSVDGTDAGTNCATSSAMGSVTLVAVTLALAGAVSIGTSNSANAPCLPVGLPGVPRGAFDKGLSSLSSLA